ncbi:SpoIIE family protein phosphatase [Streptomyces griseosporeus]|uniref:SpoIIE family protein phosphatase n=1 Tax=Streptomyces griseosporeus TaxID=1910 RepID=UPI0036F6122A
MVEARNHERSFYPLVERLRACPHHTPRALVDHLGADLVSFVGGHLGDDAAFVAIRRRPQHS